jgi:hypothetical protein
MARTARSAIVAHKTISNLVEKRLKCSETFNCRINWRTFSFSVQKSLKKAALHFPVFGFSVCNGEVGASKSKAEPTEPLPQICKTLRQSIPFERHRVQKSSPRFSTFSLNSCEPKTDRPTSQTFRAVSASVTLPLIKIDSICRIGKGLAALLPLLRELVFLVGPKSHIYSNSAFPRVTVHRPRAWHQTIRTIWQRPLSLKSIAIAPNALGPLTEFRCLFADGPGGSKCLCGEARSYPSFSAIKSQSARFDGMQHRIASRDAPRIVIAMIQNCCHRNNRDPFEIWVQVCTLPVWCIPWILPGKSRSAFPGFWEECPRKKRRKNDRIDHEHNAVENSSTICAS